MPEVRVVKEFMQANDRLAEENRELLARHGVVAFNLMASPGAGKTSLILRTIEALEGRARVGCLEGDTASRVDADRVAVAGIPVVQINTGGGCHLDAPMVRSGMDELPLGDLDILLIENVGNLVCPAGFALGEAAKVVITSIPEGDDKPYKYPAMFIAADVVVINKVDLLPYLQFDVPAYCDLIHSVNPTAEIFRVSCTSGEGIAEWADWLLAFREQALREGHPRGKPEVAAKA